jgi:hypothetical protein
VPSPTCGVAPAQRTRRQAAAAARTARPCLASTIGGCSRNSPAAHTDMTKNDDRMMIAALKLLRSLPWKTIAMKKLWGNFRRYQYFSWLRFGESNRFRISSYHTGMAANGRLFLSVAST